jgi:predicted esterase
VSVRAAAPAIVLCVLAVWACGVASSNAPAHPLQVAVRRLEVPTVAVEQTALAAVPSIRSDRVELAVAFPRDFQPEREHPILITQVTADRQLANIAELSKYAPTALEQGYVVLTAQGIPVREGSGSDTLMDRYVTVRAALRWLASEVPPSERWPIVLAGFSGGAKISQVLAVSLTLEGRRVAGVFLGGCNEDHSGLLLTSYPTVSERFSQIAFFLSAGQEDTIAPVAAVRSVAQGLRNSGAQRVELSVHSGGHQLDVRDLGKALRWFRSP